MTPLSGPHKHLTEAARVCGLCACFQLGRLRAQAAINGVSELVIMEQTGHWSVATLRLSIWLGEFFRQNAAAGLGI